MTGNVRRLVWVAVALGSAAGVAVVVVLLRGDPTYLVRRRGGGVPAPIGFPFRAFEAIILGISLLAAGLRAVSEDGLSWWPVALAGYALFALNVLAAAAATPSFPAFLLVVWLSLLLPAALYAEPIGELLRGPPWLIWALCLVALAGRLAWLAAA